MLKLNVPDMSCGHCVSTVTEAVKSVDKDAAVDIDLASHRVTVETRAEPEKVRKALEEAGYPAQEA